MNVLDFYYNLDLPHKAKTRTPLAGDMKSARLLLVPPLNDDPARYFQSPCGNQFLRMFNAILGKSVSEEYLIACISITGQKPNKARTQHLLPFVQWLRRHNKLKDTVCLGGEAFRYSFGKGYKPSMTALAGNKVFMPDSMGKMGIFVLADPEQLVIELQGDDKDYFREREMAEARRLMTDSLERLSKQYEKETEAI